MSQSDIGAAEQTSAIVDDTATGERNATVAVDSKHAEEPCRDQIASIDDSSTCCP